MDDGKLYSSLDKGKKMKLLILSIMVFLLSPAVSAGYTDLSAQQKMSGLGFLIGEWKGAGWVMSRERKKEYFSQTEFVEWRLDKTAVLIEGQGKDRDSGEITHHALAIISWQASANKFRFVSTLANGNDGNFEGQLNAEDQFVWQIEGDSGIRRFTIELNEKGQWFEIGEYSRDGETWYQFFEMTLDRVGAH